MKITYSGPHIAVVLDGVLCKQGEAVEFPDAIARSVLEQDTWSTTDKTYKPPKEA